MVFFLEFLLIHSVESAACNNFPKIFGGSSGNTRLFHIDVFNYYLALAGGTSDSSIVTGISSNIPYLALTSITAGSGYYWAKAFTLKTGYFSGV